jgi:hypothetical protein
MSVFDDLINQIREAYGNCLHYYDAGVGTSRSGQGNKRHETELFFATSFIRGTSFAMTVHQRDWPVKEVHTTRSIAAQWVGTDALYWFRERDTVDPVSSVDKLLAQCTGVCQGLMGWTMPLLIPGTTKYDPLRLLAASSISDASVGGVECICLSKTSTNKLTSESGSEQPLPSNKVSLWVDKKSHLIKKTFVTIHHGEFSLEQEAYFDFCIRRS